VNDPPKVRLTIFRAHLQHGTQPLVRSQHLYCYKLKLPSLQLQNLAQTTFRYSPIICIMVLGLVYFLIALFYVTINIFKWHILCFFGCQLYVQCHVV
jgi:hypothetical protein